MTTGINRLGAAANGIQQTRRYALPLVVAAVALWQAAGCRQETATRQEAPSTPLLCYVGGTMRPAVEALAKQFEAKTKQKVLLDFGDSGQLMIKIEQTRKGDIYVCHDPFLAGATGTGLVAEGRTISAIDPVIVVRKGNPNGIKEFADLTRPDVKLVLTDPQYSTMGHIVDRMAERAGILASLNSNVVTHTRGGGEAANAVAMGTADAAVVWNAVAFLRKDQLDALPLTAEIRLKEGVDAVTTATYGRINMDHVQVTAAVLKASTQPQLAATFVDFMASAEAQKVWLQFGFSPLIPGRAVQYVAGTADTTDRADGKRALMVHCAAGMRKAVDRLARDFEASSGVRMEMNYDGSNRLFGQIKLSRRGDIYIAGDPQYMDMALEAGLTTTGTTFCCFVPVILVKKGNPLRIETLADLLKPGIRIGQGDERAAAIGKQTPRILAMNGVARDPWKRNVVLDTPTVNELGAAVKLGTIDAAIVWSSIAADYTDDASSVEIPPAKNLVSDVQAAVLASAKDRATATAFIDFLASSNAVRVLQECGYVAKRP